MRRKEGDKNKDILDAALRVFAREGFDRAQIGAIAQEAGVGTGSVYLYFAGKDEILDGIFERFWVALRRDLEAQPEAPPSISLRTQLGLLFDRLSADPDLTRVYLRESHRHALRPSAAGASDREACLERGESTFQAGARAGVFRPDLPLGLARSFVFGGIRSVLAWWLDTLTDPDRTGDPSDLVACRETALDLAISALLVSDPRPSGRSIR